jgi:NitT/TauT family transport system substrate-binding protein
MSTMNNRMGRRRFLGMAAGSGLALVPGLRSAFAAPEVRKITITQAVPSLAFIQNYVAQSQGFFKDAGLEVEIVVTQGGGNDVKAVLSGDAAFTANDGAQVIPAIVRGQRLTCVQALLNKNIVNVSMSVAAAKKLGVSAADPIAKRLALLKGLNIGVTQPGALTWQLARFNLVKAGFNPDRDATIVGLGGGPAVAAALEKGDVDVIYISVPIGERIVSGGKAITYIDNAKGDDPNLATFMMEGLWAQPGFIDKNPGTVRAMVTALQRASAFIVNSPIEKTVEALKPALGSMGEPLLKLGVEKVRPSVASTGRFTQRDLDVTQGVLLENKIIARKVTLQEVFTDRFLGA